MKRVLGVRFVTRIRLRTIVLKANRLDRPTSYLTGLLVPYLGGLKG